MFQKKERTPHTIAAYSIKMRRIASCATVTNPLSGRMEDSNGDRAILLQNHEVEQYIHAYYTKYKGVGARKLHNRISRSFCGVSERQIQAFLNRQQISQKLHPKFINKQPPKPVTSPRVLDRIQMDIVDLQKSAVESDSRTYKYVLVVMVSVFKTIAI